MTKLYHSSYLSKIFSSPVDYAKLVNAVCRNIKKLRENVKFDAIAFRGTSGSAFAFPVSAKLKIPLILVRKTVSGSHGCEIEAYPGSSKRYVILDDFIDTGNTVNRIMNAIPELTCIGILLYNKPAIGSNPTVYTIAPQKGKYKEIPVYDVSTIK